MQKGGYFGELALVTHKPRAASVYAVGKVKLACEYNFDTSSTFGGVKVNITPQIYSLGCGSFRASPWALHGAHEAQHR